MAQDIVLDQPSDTQQVVVQEEIPQDIVVLPTIEDLPTFDKKQIGNEIDWKHVARMCEVQMSSEEIAHVVGLTRNGLLKRVQKEWKCNLEDFMAKYSSNAKANIRRQVYQIAMRPMPDPSVLRYAASTLGGLKEKDSTAVNVNTNVSLNSIQVTPELGTELKDRFKQLKEDLKA